MLGFRGCRLGIVHPSITRMQAQAILEAAAQVAAEEAAKPENQRLPPPKPKIMILLVGCAAELAAQIKVVEQAARDVFEGNPSLPKVDFEVGTMIVSFQFFPPLFFFFSGSRERRERRATGKKNSKSKKLNNKNIPAFPFLSNHSHTTTTRSSPAPRSPRPPWPPPASPASSASAATT